MERLVSTIKHHQKQFTVDFKNSKVEFNLFREGHLSTAVIFENIDVIYENTKM